MADLSRRWFLGGLLASAASRPTAVALGDLSALSVESSAAALNAAMFDLRAEARAALVKWWSERLNAETFNAVFGEQQGLA